MVQVDVLEAKADLSRLVHLVKTSRKDEIVVTRNGTPVVKNIPIDTKPVPNRIGIAEGRFTMPDDFDADNEYIAGLFREDPA